MAFSQAVPATRRASARPRDRRFRRARLVGRSSVRRDRERGDRAQQEPAQGLCRVHRFLPSPMVVPLDVARPSRRRETVRFRVSVPPNGGLRKPGQVSMRSSNSSTDDRRRRSLHATRSPLLPPRRRRRSDDGTPSRHSSEERSSVTFRTSNLQNKHNHVLNLSLFMPVNVELKIYGA